MLKINLNPQGPTYSNVVYPQPVVAWNDPVLTVDGTVYDLSELPDAATAQHPVLGTVHRTGADYECTLKLTHGANAPYETRFPAPLELTTDGDVTLPLYDEPTPEPEVSS